MRARCLRVLAGTFFWVAAGACAGPATGDVPDAAVPLQVDPTLSSIQQKIFTPSCSFASCHGGNFPQSGVDLRDAQRSFDTMVNRRARRGSCTPDAGPPVLIVVPGDPDASQLMDKLERTSAELMAACQGGPMPRANRQLPPEARDAIRQWILDGALNN